MIHSQNVSKLDQVNLKLFIRDDNPCRIMLFPVRSSQQSKEVKLENNLMQTNILDIHW